MWENLGRTLAEYAKLSKFKCFTNDERISIEGVAILDDYCKNNKSCIFFSGHFANWEIMPLIVKQRGHHITLVYRPANNPLVNKILLKLRYFQANSLIPKGPKGSREIIDHIKKGKKIAMLVDQKQNDGIPIPFFGKQAMTAPAIAKLALKYNIPLIPVSIIRKKEASFHIKFHPKLELNKKPEDLEKNIFDLMLKINEFLEESIKQNPSQWLWIHKRWN